MFSASPLVPHQLVDCVSTGRSPTAADHDTVAARMWCDGAANRSAFSWGALPTVTDRIAAMRSAAVALQGSDLL